MAPRITCEPGDLIAIVCPARKAEASALQSALSRLEAQGYRVRLGESTQLEHHQFGGTDAQRAADLMRQIADPEVRAVLCARGGYGCTRILPLLDPAVWRRHPKWLIGFSDVTALHAWAAMHSQTPTLHAAMAATMDQTEEEALQLLYRTLAGAQEPLAAPRHELNRPGLAKGRLVGGNLSVLYSLRGTPWFPDTKGAVLFIEDLDEYLYHIDRMMLNLEAGGILAGISGLIVGGITDLHDHAVPFGSTAEQIIREHLDQASVPGTGNTLPLAFGFPAGHISNNQPLIMGAEVRLEVGEQGSVLTYCKKSGE